MMLRRLFSPLTALTLMVMGLATPAQALTLTVWDRELQTKLGYGETVGGKLNMQLVGNYSGPVVVLFAQSDTERSRGTYPELQTRYDGVLRAGQLSLLDEDRLNSPLTLTKFLTTLKLTPGTWSMPSLTLPGLKAAPTEKK